MSLRSLRKMPWALALFFVFVLVTSPAQAYIKCLQYSAGILVGPCGSIDWTNATCRVIAPYPNDTRGESQGVLTRMMEIAGDEDTLILPLPAGTNRSAFPQGVPKGGNASDVLRKLLSHADSLGGGVKKEDPDLVILVFDEGVAQALGDEPSLDEILEIADEVRSISGVTNAL